MKAHPLKGVALIEPVAELSPAIPVIRSHHERWDGSGYPDGLAGEKIPRAARVVAVANAFASMTSEQTFRPALSAEQAFAELADKAGSQFDPECVTAFLKLRSRIEGLQAGQMA